MNDKITYRFSQILTIAFIVVLIVPGFIFIVQDFFGEQNILEIRLTQPKKIKHDIRNYYSEKFLFNSPFVNQYLKFKTDVLQENPIPFNVIKGQTGWYFLGNNYYNTLNDAFGNDSFSTNELTTIKNNLLSINSYLKSKHIAFYVVVVPNKNSIYKEHLPYKLKQKSTKLITLQHQLGNTDISFINLTEHLKSAKSQQQLYYKTDSHWNTFGAFIGYEKMMDHFQNKFSVEANIISDYKIETDFEIYGDLTRLLKINIPENSIYVKKINDNLSEDYTKPILRYSNGINDIKLLMFRDSFANNLIPFLNDTFGETLYLKDYTINENLIEKEKPNIIILQIAERKLRTLLNLKSPI